MVAFFQHYAFEIQFWFLYWNKRMTIFWSFHIINKLMGIIGRLSWAMRSKYPLHGTLYYVVQEFLSFPNNLIFKVALTLVVKGPWTFPFALHQFPPYLSWFPVHLPPCWLILSQPPNTLSGSHSTNLAIRRYALSL